MISFEVTYGDHQLIAAICERAKNLALAHNLPFDMLDADMDISATHANGNPLRLEDLLDADDGNFAHDFFGIQRHLNRKTGQLDNLFVPRFSQPQSA